MDLQNLIPKQRLEFTDKAKSINYTLSDMIEMVEECPVCVDPINKQNIVEGVVLSDDFKDEERMLYLLALKEASPRIWRWQPAGIKDWILDKRYLNLGGVVRKTVYEDIVKFFRYYSKNPWDREYDEAVFCEGIGCHEKGTKVIKYDGTLVKVEDVKLQDKLIGDDSKPRNVLRTIRGKEILYKIIPIKGKSFIVNKNHILSLKERYGLNEKKTRITNISVGEYLNRSDKFKRRTFLYKPLIPLKFKKVYKPKVSSYLLGLWMADGREGVFCFSVNKKDIEIINFLKQSVLKIKGCSISEGNIQKNSSDLRFAFPSRRNNFLINYLRELEIYKNKHIPYEFKIMSISDRLQFLAGYIDGDGCLLKGNTVCYSVTTSKKDIAKGIEFLILSLGFSSKIKKRARFDKRTNKTYICYDTIIGGDIERIPVKLLRKKILKKTRVKEWNVTGFKIEKLKKGNFYGFELDGNHLYLTDDFTIHHNSGKSFKTSIIATYFIHLLLCMRNPQKYFGMSESSKIGIINMSVSELNAKKVIFSEILSKISVCPWFNERPWDRDDSRVPDPNCLSELKFKNNVFVIPGSSSWRTAVGYNILVGIIDEAGAYRHTNIGDQCEDIYNALQRRLGSRFEGKGAIIMAGSPMFEQDFVESKLKEGKKKYSRVMAVRRTLWDAKYADWSGDYFYVDRVNRVILDKIPDEMKNIDKIPHIPFLFKAFQANVTKAYRDFGAYPSKTINSFFEIPSIILDRINKSRIEEPMDKHGRFKSWFKPINPLAFHTIHVDLALSGDAAGMALGHYDGLNQEGGVKIYIDLMVRLMGTKKSPIQLSKVREIIYALTALGFPIGLITYDGFQSSDSSQILTKKGYIVEYLSVDRTTGPYEDLKESITEDRLDYYYDSTGTFDEPTPSQVFVKEASELEDIEGKKVDHAVKGSKDVCDGICGVVRNIVANPDKWVEMSVEIIG